MRTFEKISQEQFNKDFGAFIETDMTSYEDVKIPRRATKRSAGYDFFAPYSMSIAPGHSRKIPTGIRVNLDDDKFLAIVPRSGLGFKYRLQLDNTIGIIDADYRDTNNEGHMWIKIPNDNREGRTLHIEKGEAFAQGIVMKYYTTDDDDADGVRVGGLGSTTIKNETRKEDL